MRNDFNPWPAYTKEEADAISRTLLSNRVNYWTGDAARRFEKQFARSIGCRHAVALANGTVALDLALKALAIGEGDEVIVPARSFIASASCVVNAGAVPVFADVDPVSQNITAASIRERLTKRTRAVICVHLAGWPCDMDPIRTLASEHNLKIIEDCAQAHGATYKGSSVGTLGHVAAWSFCQDKIMSTGGEGGMLTTNDDTIRSIAWSYKDHGKSWKAVYERKHAPGFRWLHESFGTNWRMTEIQAVIGLIQLRRLPQWCRQRRKNADLLSTGFEFHPVLKVTRPPQKIQHAYYKYYTFIRPERLKSSWTRDRIVETVMNLGVPCYTGICPEIYLEKAFQNSPYAPNQRLPVCKELGATSLMFLVHPTLTEDQIDKTIEAVRTVLKSATA